MKKYIINKTNVFNRWFRKLPKPIKLRITQRLERIKDGNLGDNKWFGDIGEFRFFFGSGYRTTPYKVIKLFFCFVVAINLAKMKILKKLVKY